MGWIFCAVSAVLFLNSLGAPVPSSNVKNAPDVDPPLLPNSSHKFADTFKYTLKMCGAFTSNEANELRDSIVMLTKALEVFLDMKDADRVLLKAAAASIARTVVEAADGDSDISAKTECVVLALKTAFLVTSGIPDLYFIKEVEKMIKTLSHDDIVPDNSLFSYSSESYSGYFDDEEYDSSEYFDDEDYDSNEYFTDEDYDSSEYFENDDLFEYYDEYYSGYFDDYDSTGFFEEYEPEYSDDFDSAGFFEKYEPDYLDDYDSYGFFEEFEPEYFDGPVFREPNFDEEFEREGYGLFEEPRYFYPMEEPRLMDFEPVDYDFVPFDYGAIEIPIGAFEFPIEEFDIPFEEVEFPFEEYEFPVDAYEFPIEAYEFPIEEYEFPFEESKFPAEQMIQYRPEMRYEW